MDASTSGVLGINDAGCVTIGEALLMATAGSSVLPDGSGVRIEGYGEYQFGDTVSDWGGGEADLAAPATDYEAPVIDCISKTEPETVMWVLASR